LAHPYSMYIEERVYESERFNGIVMQVEEWRDEEE
jgi:hypothetical protein